MLVQPAQKPPTLSLWEAFLWLPYLTSIEHIEDLLQDMEGSPLTFAAGMDSSIVK